MEALRAISYVYARCERGRQPERFVILVAAPVRGGVLLHEEHTQGASMLLNRVVPPLPPEQTVEAWLAQRNQELAAEGWSPPSRVAGIC
ncbi:hypothetical protein [Nonomuraea aridisoli]|uniref:Uncharacterized protein n=1 Tax=Nonomuraea aridisoli TaxID=2070368 RepID=A0A2W2E6K8_9ACTN|nr:hypothetical protein [Nonomuraea aridisoli]PZG18011.1 hypothetical protein C1J01_16190 [Nonomuraea aridisoli]